ncbi:MAG: VWA domain-containing protein [Planctomycetes bacterium]|nr:VWA domain-containing protein [Planctomycetota bacterium]
MSFEAPALLLLVLPVGILYWRGIRPRGQGKLLTFLHVVMLALGLLALAGPQRMAAQTGLDLVLVVDRSRSMPPDAPGRIQELVGLIERQRPPHSRLGVVTVGAQAQVEQMPEEEGRFGGFVKTVDPDASNLADGIETALYLIPSGRAGRIVVFSDGLATGRSPTAAASLAATRGVPVDHRLFSRPALSDVAIQRIQVPAETDAGAAFRFTTWIQSDEPTSIRYRCLRNDALISSGEVAVPAGASPLYFQDRLPRRGGLYRYRVEVERVQGEDPMPENNVATAVLRALDAPRVLVVTNHARKDNVVAVLEAAGFLVDQVAPASVPGNVGGLDAYRMVVLEDVSANDVGGPAMRALREFVEEGGGGLAVTGGRASFGVGGYFQSELDPILPVSMEIRQEHRKFRLAMAIALDRSGSMTADVGGGLVKMDLANRGAAEAVKTLSPMDEVAVIAVDSSAHMMVALTPVKDSAEIIGKVLRIRSEGGGIFVYTALAAAGKALEKATAATRHVVLFADAADAEEPGEYETLLEKFRAAGVTVSVIGLGTEKDVDADFLKDVARRGGGRVFFTNQPEDLPRLFAQETLSVARSSFVDDPVAARWLPDAHLIGDVARRPLPELRGYNLTYLRENAAIGAVAQDEYKAPVLAFWHRGTGRVAAFTAEADGPTSGPLLAWEGYATFFSELGRWLMGPPEPEGASVTVRVEEPEVVVRFEYDADSPVGREIPQSPPALTLLTGDGAGAAKAPFEWVGEHALEARFSMEREGVYLPVVRFGSGRVIKAAPVTLPYSPEFLPRGRSVSGQGMLAEVAARGGGVRLEGVDGIFDRAGSRVMERSSLRVPVAMVILVLLVFEVAARRLRWWDVSAVVRVERGLGAWGGRLRRRGVVRPPAKEAVVPVAEPVVEAAPPPAEEGMRGALAKAKERVRRRWGG